MPDANDLKLWKMQMAFELATRLIPEKPRPQESWTENNYLGKAQQTLEKANKVVKRCFQSSRLTNTNVIIGVE